MNMYGESSSDPFELKKLARLRISDVYTETRVFLIVEIHAITLFNHRIIELSSHRSSFLRILSRVLIRFYFYCFR